MTQKRGLGHGVEMLHGLHHLGQFRRRVGRRVATKAGASVGPATFGWPLPRLKPPHRPACLKQRKIIVAPASPAADP